MAISLKKWQKMFDVTADLLLEHADELSRIDAVIGDGDHGLTIAKIAKLMKEKCALEYTTASEFFDDLGWDAINVQGGSAGPLFGTYIMGMKNAPEGASAATVMECALKELQSISKAVVGEKTMMDAIIPATEAMKEAKTDAESLEAAARAAKAGSEATANFAAKYGRAKNYGEKSLGVKDAGSCSMALIFEGLKTGYERYKE